MPNPAALSEPFCGFYLSRRASGVGEGADYESVSD